ncbi:MAG: metal-sensitive transcriptional regulator [Acidimicrobiales bacterium]
MHRHDGDRDGAAEQHADEEAATEIGDLALPDRFVVGDRARRRSTLEGPSSNRPELPRPGGRRASPGRRRRLPMPSVPKFTTADCTPGVLASAVSTLATQEAHDMPETRNSPCSRRDAPTAGADVRIGSSSATWGEEEPPEGATAATAPRDHHRRFRAVHDLTSTVTLHTPRGIVHGMAGYSLSKDDYLTRLRRIEGQVRGLQRQIEEDRYCIDVLTQISSVTKALQGVGLGLLDEHVRHCVRGAVLESDEAGDTKITEAIVAVERLLRS